MKKYLLLLPAICCAGYAFSNNPIKKDTLYTELKNDIVVLSSTKETNSLRTLPAAVSVFSQKNLEGMQIHNLKDLSGFVPNYFASDYGSKMTAPLYIRGIGARSGTQTVSMYVDNIPYFNMTSFDTELYDIQRVEVLRGTQGTLYGRNAMGGILNVYTYSPLEYEGSMLQLGGGNYGSFEASASSYQKLNDKMGVAVSGYYKKDDGYFTNEYSGNKVDDMKNAGGRVKFAWKINPRLQADYSISYDFVDQGAFPYADIETNKINYNSEGYYKRNLITNGLSFRYQGNGYEVHSTTGYQYLNDEMNMDQDYTPLSKFQINQRQKQNSLSQEFTVKSDNTSDYQWSYGVYGFYDYLHTTPPVYMMKDGIAILQSVFDRLEIVVPNFPSIKYTDDQLDLDGNYKRPNYGAAVFHQSTFNNILSTDGLSLTLGLRLDYEKAKLDYNAYTAAHLTVQPQGSPMIIPFEVTPSLVGTTSEDFLELLPKAVLKYQIQPQSYVYVSASKGYKTGGHNIQIFADLLQEELQNKINAMMPGNSSSGAEATPIEDRITFKPEYSWNYEIGGNLDIINNTLSTNFALYYIDVKDIQITKFVKSLGGRMVQNAGSAVSKGFELGLKARPCSGFYLYANYGFADAKFKDYTTDIKDAAGNAQTVDYSNNRIPFAPRSTFNVGANISCNIKNNPVLDRISLDASYMRIGRVYWTEENDLSEPSYNTVDARLTVEKNIFSLEFWGKNIFDEDYRTFLFESSGNHFAQSGKPARWGASLKIKL